MTQKLGYRLPDAALYIGVSETKFRQMVQDGRMPKPYRIDGIVLWRYDDLQAAFDRLTRESDGNPWDKAVGA